MLASDAAARDFISDAYAHAKFIVAADSASALLDKAGVERDAGVFAADPDGIAAFVEACAALRFWEREARVHA